MITSFCNIQLMNKLILASLLFTLVIFQSANRECFGTVPGCTNCSDSETCVSCNTIMGFLASPDDSGKVCNCAPEYTKSQSVCVLCSLVLPGCDECSIAPTLKCSSCYDETPANESSTTLPCSSTCETQQNKIGCKSCQSGSCLQCDTARNFSQRTNNQGQCVCKENYVSLLFNRHYCVPCSYAKPGCISCSQTGDCITCDANFTLDTTSNRCVCPSPLYSLSDNVSYFVVMTCGPCSQNCKTCVSSTECGECDAGFGVNSFKKCQQCSDVGCVSCDQVDNCVTCDEDKNFVDAGEGNCKCSGGYYLQGTTCVICPQSLKNCLTCSSQSVCTKCAPRFFVNSEGKCQDCGASCVECLDQTHCTQCDLQNESILNSENQCVCPAGYYQLGNDCFLCKEAMDGCLQCPNSTVCTVCDAGNNFESNPSNRQCRCKTGHYFVAGDTDICSECSESLSNCNACSNASNCNDCEEGYGLNLVSDSERSCVSCIISLVGCSSCQTTTICTSCNASLNFVPNGTSCSCRTGYYLNSSNQCQLCSRWSSQCLQCTNLTCTQCSQNYQVNNTGCSLVCNMPLCLSCFNSTTCSLCAPFSSISTNRQSCNCNQGYYLSSNSCVACSIPNCASCSSDAVCSECEEGFVINTQSNQCVAFEFLTKVSLLLLFALLMATL